MKSIDVENDETCFPFSRGRGGKTIRTVTRKQETKKTLMLLLKLSRFHP